MGFARSSEASKKLRILLKKLEGFNDLSRQGCCDTLKEKYGSPVAIAFLRDRSTPGPASDGWLEEHDWVTVVNMPELGLATRHPAYAREHEALQRAATLDLNVVWIQWPLSRGEEAWLADRPAQKATKDVVVVHVCSGELHPDPASVARQLAALPVAPIGNPLILSGPECELNAALEKHIDQAVAVVLEQRRDSCRKDVADLNPRLGMPREDIRPSPHSRCSRPGDTVTPEDRKSALAAVRAALEADQRTAGDDARSQFGNCLPQLRDKMAAAARAAERSDLDLFRDTDQQRFHEQICARMFESGKDFLDSFILRRGAPPLPGQLTDLWQRLQALGAGMPDETSPRESDEDAALSNTYMAEVWRAPLLDLVELTRQRLIEKVFIGAGAGACGGAGAGAAYYFVFPEPVFVLTIALSTVVGYYAIRWMRNEAIAAQMIQTAIVSMNDLLSERSSAAEEQVRAAAERIRRARLEPLHRGCAVVQEALKRDEEEQQRWNFLIQEAQQQAYQSLR